MATESAQFLLLPRSTALSYSCSSDDDQEEEMLSLLFWHSGSHFAILGHLSKGESAETVGHALAVP